MNKTIFAIFFTAGLTACTQYQPICDREAVEWNKWGTTEEPAECRASAKTVRVGDFGAIPCDCTSEPLPPVQHPLDPPVERVKGNNGWGNGDQAAPGNSRHNNAAENKDGNSQRNHGNARPN